MEIPNPTLDSFPRLRDHTLDNERVASTSANNPPLISPAERPQEMQGISQSIPYVSENIQSSEIDHEELSKRLTTSLTVGCNNRQTNYIITVAPQGSTTTHNSGDQVHEPMEQVLSPGTPLRNDIERLKTRLSSIIEEYTSSTYDPPGVTNSHVHFPTSHNKCKTPGAPSLKSRVTHRSTQTLTGTEKYLEPMEQKDLKLPKSLPYYMRTYTLALSLRLANSNRTICLWGPYPNQNLSQSLQEKHCTLGDVGTFDQYGNFEVFFNIFMSKEENAQMNYRPPENFHPLEVQEYEYAKPTQQDDTQFYTDDIMAYKTVNNETGHFSFIFESMKRPSIPGGAILALPEGYTRGALLSSVIHDINLYLQDHVESWYSTANHWNSDNNLQDGALKIISTCYKSSIWGAGVLSSNGYQPAIPPIKLKMERLSFNERYKWTGAEGPSIRLNHGSTKQDTKDIRYTIAVEVLSVYRVFPRTKKNFFNSFTSNKTAGSMATASKLSLRSRLTKPFTNSWSRLSIS